MYGPIPFSALGYFVFLALYVGDPLAYFHIQASGWGQGLRNPIDVLFTAATGLRNSIAASVLIAGAVALAVGVWLKRMPLPLAAFGLLTPAVSLGSMLHGSPRYTMAIFPVYLVVTAISLQWRLALILLLAAAQAVYVCLWLNNSPYLA